MKVTALRHERLFEPFLDPVDGVLCLPADATAAEVARLAAPAGLRFPLWLDPAQPLRTNWAASDHAPASSRFGPFCDNCTGMNWELPDGRVVRVGERVVKSTTGYDLLRFLLAAGPRFGRAQAVVLRLRPLCDREGAFFLQGSDDALEKVAAQILQGPYLHWLESVDWLAPSAGRPQLRLGVHCPAAEWAALAAYLGSLAGPQALDHGEKPGPETAADGIPDLAVKTTPDRVIPLCRELTRAGQLHCVGLCYPGVVHAYLPPGGDPAATIDRLVSQHGADWERDGGDWISRHASRAFGNEAESRWVRDLTTAWKAAA